MVIIKTRFTGNQHRQVYNVTAKGGVTVMALPFVMNDWLNCKFFEGRLKNLHQYDILIIP